MDGARVIFRLTIFLILLFLSCTKKNSSSKRIKQNGFVIVNDSDQWRFIPAKSMHSDDCFDDLSTDNLLTGFSFSVFSCPHASYVKRTMDTLRIDEMNRGVDSTFQISPVSMEYETDEPPKANPKLRSNFRAHVRGRILEYKYDIFPVRIIDVNPLFCLDKKHSNITECACKHRDDDPDEYLLKICKYIKKKDRYSDLPCKYGIRQISEDSIDARLAIKVELTCCYLGDIAFFDKQTKELIEMHYGAK